MNNVSIINIKKSFEDVSKLFDPEKSTYQMIMHASKSDTNTKEMIDDLLKIGDTKDYPEELQDYFHNRFKELQELEEQNEIIEDLQNEILKENKDLQQEFFKRGVAYDENFDFNNEYENMTYMEKKDYIEKLRVDLNNLKEKNRSIKEEKKTGEEFKEEIEESMESDDLKNTLHDEKMKKINEEAENNFINYTSPTLDQVKNYYNYISDYQTENSKLNIEVERKENGLVELKMGYKGTEVNEKLPMIVCSYDNLEYFNKEIYPYILSEHAKDNDIKEIEQKENSLESENSYGETLEVIGNESMINSAEESLDSNSYGYVDSPVQDRGIARVRKIDNNVLNNSAFNSIGIYMIIIGVIVIILAMLVYVYFIK